MSTLAWLIVAGFPTLFVLEQFLHWHHCHRAEHVVHRPLGHLLLGRRTAQPHRRPCRRQRLRDRHPTRHRHLAVGLTLDDRANQEHDRLEWTPLAPGEVLVAVCSHGRDTEVTSIMRQHHGEIRMIHTATTDAITR
ncbi:MAG: hypothetical protein ACO35E_03475 [Ilumatobacteraceae bacterium]